MSQYAEKATRAWTEIHGSGGGRVGRMGWENSKPGVKPWGNQHWILFDGIKAVSDGGERQIDRGEGGIEALKRGVEFLMGDAKVVAVVRGIGIRRILEDI